MEHSILAKFHSLDEEFIISLEISWNYMFKMGSHDPFGYLKHKL
jgi:hypothetical protein